jgi:hypothetical protein
MSRYRQGLSVVALREQYDADVQTQSAEELALLYGNDKPRFLGDDAHSRMRTTSFHLRAPLYEDDRGRQYTPVEEPHSVEWWVRIPPRYARRLFQAIRAGDEPGEDAVVDYPRADEVLRMRRVVYGRIGARNDPAAADYTITVQVDEVVDTRAKASVYISLKQPLDSVRSGSQVQALSERAQRDLQRRRDRADRVYNN